MDIIQKGVLKVIAVVIFIIAIFGIALPYLISSTDNELVMLGFVIGGGVILLILNWIYVKFIKTNN